MALIASQTFLVIGRGGGKTNDFDRTVDGYSVRYRGPVALVSDTYMNLQKNIARDP
ncbi:MAG: hypothetical protein ACLU4J_16965 [Butyricimonas paravirosa]